MSANNLNFKVKGATYREISAEAADTLDRFFGSGYRPDGLYVHFYVEGDSVDVSDFAKGAILNSVFIADVVVTW